MKNLLNSKLFRYFFVSFFIILLGTTLGYHQITPTRAPKDFNDEAISLEDIKGQEANFSMAMRHVFEMAKEPHASGSPEIEYVRKYLVKQFEIIGVDYQIQEFKVDMREKIDTAVNNYNSYIGNNPDQKEANEEYFASLGFSSYEEKYRDDIFCTDSDYIDCINYIVKLDAPNTEKGVMLVSHYDSVYSGPGAADDLISVASMLEALRQTTLKNDLTNDVYFLFTDAEELYLHGARAYVKEFPEMINQIDLVLNLEARGNSGTILMFETSDNNKGMVTELNHAVDHISMFSFTAALYKLMSNNTDLTEFLNAGYNGMNFAMVDSPENYHEMTDNYENLNRDIAYMQFKTTVDMTEYFSKSNLDNLTSNEDAVYFPFFKGNTFIASNLAMFIFSCIIGFLSFLWICYLLFRKETRAKECIFSAFIIIAAFIIVAFVGVGGAYIYNKLWYSGKWSWVELASALNMLYYFICFLAITLLLLIIYIICQKTKCKQTLIISGMLLFNIFHWIIIFLFNSVAYIFTIPLCFLLLFSIILYFIILLK